MNPAWRARLKKLGLLLGSVTAVLLIAELVLAISGLYPPVPFTHVGDFPSSKDGAHFIADPKIGWRMRPFTSYVKKMGKTPVTYKADELGFRVGPDSLARRDRDRTLVMAGDSYLWGSGVVWEKTCAGRIEAWLERWTVRNLSMPGFGLGQIMSALREYGTALEPDLIIVGLYPADFTRSFFAYRDGFNKPVFELDGGRLVPRTKEDAPGALGRLVERKSRVFGLIRRFSWKMGHEGYGAWWRLNAAFLDAIRKTGERCGCPVLFLHIPYASWRPFPGCADYMQRCGAHYIDVFALDPESPETLYFRGDRHLNQRGHRFVARSIRDWMQEQGLID